MPVNSPTSQASAISPLRHTTPATPDPPRARSVPPSFSDLFPPPAGSQLDPTIRARNWDRLGGRSAAARPSTALPKTKGNTTRSTTKSSSASASKSMRRKPTSSGKRPRTQSPPSSASPSDSSLTPDLALLGQFQDLLRAVLDPPPPPTSKCGKCTRCLCRGWKFSDTIAAISLVVSLVSMGLNITNNSSTQHQASETLKATLWKDCQDYTQFSQTRTCQVLDGIFINPNPASSPLGNVLEKKDYIELPSWSTSAPLVQLASLVLTIIPLGGLLAAGCWLDFGRLFRPEYKPDWIYSRWTWYGVFGGLMVISSWLTISELDTSDYWWVYIFYFLNSLFYLMYLNPLSAWYFEKYFGSQVDLLVVPLVGRLVDRLLPPRPYLVEGVLLLVATICLCVKLIDLVWWPDVTAGHNM